MTDAPPPFETAPGLAGLKGIRHGFFGRKGGVSTGLYASLNAGRGSDDDPAAVVRNREIIRTAMGAEALLSCHQIHSANVVHVTEAWDDPRPEADAMVTAQPGLALCILTADCTPVLFADAEAGVIGAAHAGWKGALGGVLEATVASMTEIGARPGRIRAAIGPTIGQASYEVGPEFRDTFLETSPPARATASISTCRPIAPPASPTWESAMSPTSASTPARWKTATIPTAGATIAASLTMAEMPQ